MLGKKTPVRLNATVHSNVSRGMVLTTTNVVAGHVYEGIGMANTPLTILKNSISLVLPRLICKGSQLSSWIKRVTFPVRFSIPAVLAEAHRLAL